MRIWPISSISWKGLHPVTKIKSLGKSAGCNSWKSGNLYGFRSKSFLSISLVKLDEISAICDKCLIDSDGSFEMTIFPFLTWFFIFLNHTMNRTSFIEFFNHCRDSRPIWSIFRFIFCSPGSLNAYRASQNNIFFRIKMFFINCKSHFKILYSKINRIKMQKIDHNL